MLCLLSLWIELKLFKGGEAPFAYLLPKNRGICMYIGTNVDILSFLGKIETQFLGTLNSMPKKSETQSLEF